MRSICVTRIVLACAALCFSAGTCAQYIWLDEKGVRQYSDMPPGPSVPASRILQQPAAQPRPQGAPGPAAQKSDGAPAAGETRSAPTLAERNAEFQKRRAEQAEKEKKAAEEAKRASDKQAECERLRGYNRTLESGQRLFTTAPSGGRHYLTPEERSKQLEENNKYLEGCPNG